MKLKIHRLRDNAVLPEVKTVGSAGYDLTVSSIVGCESEKVDGIFLKPGDIVRFGAGFSMEMEPGYVADIRSRSGMAIKRGLAVVNSPGTIDSDYRGEIVVAIINLGKDSQLINIGDRIAQMLFFKHENPYIEEDENLSQTSRGDGGFGSTGL